MKTFIWDISKDSSESVSHAVTRTQFGDGYEQVVSHGINNACKSWSCTKTDTKAVIDAIYRFLHDTKGVEVFNFTPIPNEPTLKVRLDGEIARTYQGGNVWTINFTLKQTF
ncbi:phage tail protein [Moraxella sp. ZJ142]|uniref:phage tail protein n=1 Tax=Moraxella marmotae TaxID=3344520 RepID=UPI0035D423EC